jgi:hypothetical protein
VTDAVKRWSFAGRLGPLTVSHRTSRAAPGRLPGIETDIAGRPRRLPEIETDIAGRPGACRESRSTRKYAVASAAGP